MRLRRIWGRPAGIGVALVACLVATAAPTAAAAGGTPDAAEAWFDTAQTSLCSSPVGCPVALPASYRADTLHVGLAAGSETARTYVQPDLSAYLGGPLPPAGTMTLPLATVTGNGNSNPSTAVIEACLSKASFKDGTSGSDTPPPGTDCSVHARLRYTEGAFTLDLAPFLAAWNHGAPQYGLALVPDPTAATPSASWHVAFNGRNLAGAPHISSTLAGAPPPPSGPVPGPPAAAGGPPPAGAAGSAQGASSSQSAGSFSLPSSVAPAGSVPGASGSGTAPAIAPSPGRVPVLSGVPGGTSSSAGASQPASAAAPGSMTSSGILGAGSGRGGFQYPEIFLLPLLLAGGGLFAARLLTSDATPDPLSQR